MLATFNIPRSLSIYAAVGIWLAACLASRQFATTGFADLMLYVWWANIFLLPLSFAIAGAMLLKSPARVPSHSQFIRVLTSVAIVACVFAGYAMSVAVLERVSAVWWERVKFGGYTISLGKAAAEYFFIAALAVGSSIFALHRFAPVGARMAFLCRAAFGLVVGAALLYILLGLSPYAEWRA